MAQLQNSGLGIRKSARDVRVLVRSTWSHDRVLFLTARNRDSASKGFVMVEDSEEDAMRAKARMHGIEYVPPQFIDAGRYLSHLIPEAVARSLNVVPWQAAQAGKVLKVLISDPMDFEAIDKVRFYWGGPIDVALASLRAIRESIDRVYEAPDA